MGLTDLIRSPELRMSLPAAMNAMRRGELARPTDSTLGGLVTPEALPDRPEPRPPAWHAEVDAQTAAQRRQDEADRAEMRMLLLAKRADVQASAVAGDTLTGAQDAARRFEIQRRLDTAEAQLTENSSG